MEDDRKKVVYFPAIPTKSQWSSFSYSKAVQEAPYRALIGVVLDGRVPESHPENPRHRIRNQTGLTNRWRLPQSLQSDMLGTSQALKAVNMPFDQNLVNTLSSKYPSINPMLLTCPDLAYANERNWSLFAKTKAYKPSSTDDDEENHLPPI